LSFRMLACDYDRTLANDGELSSEPQQAVADLTKAGWLAALVTGRGLQDLLTVCPNIAIFNLVVAENGAVLYLPQTSEPIDLSPPPPPKFISELARRDIPFSRGRVIVATEAQFAADVLSVIRELRLDLKPVLNRDSAMFLPDGIDKASGLTAGAARLGIEMSQIIGVGDAENDITFLAACGFSVAVQNAIEPVKERADHVTALPNGNGVVAFIRERLLAGPSAVPLVRGVVLP